MTHYMSVVSGDPLRHCTSAVLVVVSDTLHAVAGVPW